MMNLNSPGDIVKIDYSQYDPQIQKINKPGFPFGCSINGL